MARTLLLSLLLLLTSVAPAWAHPLAPAGLDVKATDGGRVVVRFKQAVRQPRGAHLTPRFPSQCRRRDAHLESDADSVTEVFTLDCTGPLEGARFGVDGLDASGLDVVVRVELASGQVHRGLLDGSRAEMVVPARERPAAVALGYLRMGIEHLLGGPDHLLFVLGMLLLIRQRRKLLLALTAFTAGHSVTLCAAALGWLSVPQPPVEVAIALSLMLLALQLLEPKPPRHRSLWLVAASFGLLHGLGFAGALAQAGLPRGEVPLALGCFNAGIEIAQLGVVVVAMACAPLARRVLPGSPAWRRQLPAYALGGLAAMWCIERTLTALA